MDADEIRRLQAVAEAVAWMGDLPHGGDGGDEERAYAEGWNDCLETLRERIDLLLYSDTATN